MNLQEHIRRILREDEYSPAGKEIIPNKIVIHKSNPKVRDKISNEGLKVRAGECYKIYAGYGEKCIPAIFATNSTNKRASFDSTYDDDVWEIDTEMIPDVKWYKDRHYESRSKHIVTFENIPVNAITLKHEGTGKDWGLMESNDDKFNKKSMIGTFQDIVDETLDEIKNICEELDSDTFPDWLSFDACDVVDSIDKITIVNIERKKGISGLPMFEVDVNLIFNTVTDWYDYDDFMYSLSDRIIGKWKIHFIFNIKEQENSNKREMWESDEYKNNIRKPFKLSDPSTRIEEDRVQIRLGRNMYNHFGKVQNIIIKIDNEDITSEDGVDGLGQMNIVINDGEIYVGNIVIPEKYRGQGIATIVYQKISDHFGLPIVNSITKGRNQLDQGGQIWKNREKFEPRNIQESIRKVLREEKLHATPQELIKNLPKELKELLFKQWGAKQNPEWHPEGNTLKHIIVVIKRAYHHYPDDPNMVMAALFHDLGKIDTYKINPKTNQPTAYGHEDKSTDYVEKFKDWIESFEGMDVEEIKYLVKNHMKVKPSTWDQMKDKKKEPIMSHPSFDKLMGFTDKLDGGGTDLKESIRKILKEEDQRQRYLKSTDSLRKVITLFLNNYIEDANRMIGKKSRNYGNLREDWCVNGKEVITAIYYYEDDKFYSGSLMVTKKLIEKIMKIFNVRKNFLMSVVEEWYEDTMIPKFEQIVGETGFYFDDVDLFDRDHDCIPEPVKPEDITDEEMLEFIVDNTLYRRDEVINQIESGERDLEDFYLDIVNTVEFRKRY